MDDIKLSICIVTYQAGQYLRDCLNSIKQNPPAYSYECIVIDNHSTDGTPDLLKVEFPEVKLIENPQNLGFTEPMNQALKVAGGEYLLELNPDTIIHPQSLNNLISFMDTHPDAGICGPKVLNRDGTLQKPCRRGESRPWAVISYFTGLAALFPKSKYFGEYLVSYLDENYIHPVAGVSGSCMLIRREVINQIGYLDERFFAWQEDADFCFRAREADWGIYYVPESQITHIGGQGGSRVHPYRSIIEWHKSYFLFYRKNYAKDYFFLFNGLYYLAMAVKLILSLGLYIFRQDKFPGSRKPV
jgi:GT2 family glycosyltransferase